MIRDKLKEHIVAITIAVISGIILMIIEPARDLFFSIIKLIMKILEEVFVFFYNFLTSSHELNGSLIFILSVLSFLLIFFVLMLLWEKLKSQTSKDYNEDTFYNVVWRWRWYHGEIESLWCYCPNCDLALAYDDSSTRGYSQNSKPRTDFICDHCREIITTIPKHDKNYILGIIKREIDRKIRNNLHVKDKADTK